MAGIDTLTGKVSVSPGDAKKFLERNKNLIKTFGDYEKAKKNVEQNPGEVADQLENTANGPVFTQVRQNELDDIITNYGDSDLNETMDDRVQDVYNGIWNGAAGVGDVAAGNLDEGVGQATQNLGQGINETVDKTVNTSVNVGENITEWLDKNKWLLSGAGLLLGGGMLLYLVQPILKIAAAGAGDE